MDLFGNSHPTELPFETSLGDQVDAAWDQHVQGYRVAVPHGEITYIQDFFDAKTSDRALDYCQENDSFDWKQRSWRDLSPADFGGIQFKNIRWKQDSISLFGKRSPLPRLTSWYGDSGKPYTYSGIRSTPNEWNKGLLYIKQKVEACAGVEFNSVLLNWYRDGQDKISWHADDEVELGRNPVIASVSFGATRDFLIRNKDDHKLKLSFPLRHGSLLVMAGELQHHWQHSVPPRKLVSESRFNLTFRRIGVS
jgi:alkylated DNA repair dioxygenase AlkB